MLDARRGLLGRLVPADAGFPFEVPDHRLEHGAGRERRTRVVEMDDAAAARGVRAGSLDVDQGLPLTGQP